MGLFLDQKTYMYEKSKVGTANVGCHGEHIWGGPEEEWGAGTCTTGITDRSPKLFTKDQTSLHGNLRELVLLRWTHVMFKTLWWNKNLQCA